MLPRRNRISPDMRARRGNVVRITHLFSGLGLRHGGIREDLTPPQPPVTHPAPSSFAAQVLDRSVVTADVGLPGRPVCLGRGRLVEHLVSAMLSPSPRPLLLVGMAGVGKTTVALSAVHDDRVQEWYRDRRLFVCVDGTDTARSIAALIANALALPPAAEPLSGVLAMLATRPTVLILDRLDVPWREDAQATEALLGRLAALPTLVLLATSRPHRRVSAFSGASIVAVAPLSPPDARILFVRATQGRFVDDPYLERLTADLHGLPQAIVQVAQQALPEGNLSAAWRRLKTAAANLHHETVADSPLLALDEATRAAVSAVGGNAVATALLAMLGLLPNGLACGDLTKVMPDDGPAAAARLQLIGLAQHDGERLTVLPAIREYARRHLLPAETDLRRLVDHAALLAHRHEATGGASPAIGDRTGGDATRRLAAEAANVQSVLFAGLTLSDPTPAIAAAIAFAGYQAVSGYGSTRLLAAAAATAGQRRLPVLKAACVENLGVIALARHDLADAHACYEEASQIYRDACERKGEARCIARLSEIER
jgi:hypothetical protein